MIEVSYIKMAKIVHYWPEPLSQIMSYRLWKLVQKRAYRDNHNKVTRSQLVYLLLLEAAANDLL